MGVGAMHPWRSVVGEEDRLFELGPGEVTAAERLEEGSSPRQEQGRGGWPSALDAAREGDAIGGPAPVCWGEEARREMQGTQRRELGVRKQPTSRGKARPHGKGGCRRMEQGPTTSRGRAG
jgi:hypothetical protein